MAARQTLPCKMHITQEMGLWRLNEDSTSNPTPLYFAGANILGRKKEGTVRVQAASMYLLRGCIAWCLNIGFVYICTSLLSSDELVTSRAED